MTYLTSPLWGGADQPHTPKLKFLISPLRSSDQCNFILWWKLSILWKFEQDWSALRGVLGWSTIWLYPRYLHSQYMYFVLNMYFLSNTLLNSLLEMPTLTHQMVYCLTYALVCKFWEHLNPPQPCQLHASWSPFVTPIIIATLDVILKPMQLDLVYTSWFSGQISEL